MYLNKLRQASFQHNSSKYTSFSFSPPTNSSPKSNFFIMINSKIMATTKILHLAIFFAMISTLVQSQQVTKSRKLDETPPDLENKCGGCPCNNPCNPPPSPPPPALPPPSPPPPKKQPPPSNYCPPPPSGGGGQYPPNPPYIYINGPPGNLYPVDPYYSGSGRSFSLATPFLINIVLGLIAFW